MRLRLQDIILAVALYVAFAMGAHAAHAEEPDETLGRPDSLQSDLAVDVLSAGSALPLEDDLVFLASISLSERFKRFNLRTQLASEVSSNQRRFVPLYEDNIFNLKAATGESWSQMLSLGVMGVAISKTQDPSTKRYALSGSLKAFLAKNAASVDPWPTFPVTMLAAPAKPDSKKSESKANTKDEEALEAEKAAAKKASEIESFNKKNIEASLAIREQVETTLTSLSLVPVPSDMVDVLETLRIYHFQVLVEETEANRFEQKPDKIKEGLRLKNHLLIIALNPTTGRRISLIYNENDLANEFVHLPRVGYWENGPNDKTSRPSFTVHLDPRSALLLETGRSEIKQIPVELRQPHGKIVQNIFQTVFENFLVPAEFRVSFSNWSGASLCVNCVFNQTQFSRVQVNGGGPRVQHEMVGFRELVGRIISQGLMTNGSTLSREDTTESYFAFLRLIHKSFPGFYGDTLSVPASISKDFKMFLGNPSEEEK